MTDKWNAHFSRLVAPLRVALQRIWRGQMPLNPLIKYVALAFAAIVVIVLALAPLTAHLIEGWSRRDLELRSRLVFRSIRDQVATGLSASPTLDLTQFFERLVEDERLHALGFCAENGQLRHATKLLANSAICKEIKRASSDMFAMTSDGGRRILIGAFPVAGDASTGHLLVLHDLTFADERIEEVRLYSILALAGVSIGLGLLATVITLTLMRGWTRSVRSAIMDARPGGDPTGLTLHNAPFSRELSALLSDLHAERKFTDGIHVEWSPKTLRQLLVDELPSTEIIVVSNREPYIHNRDIGSIALQIPASGLVAALEPVMRACGGTWIAHGSGTADRETTDSQDRIRVPPADPVYTLRRVWLSEEEQDGYYYGFANEGLWPLCHIAFVRPTFREEDWLQYQAVNKRFADAVVQEANRDDPIILVQDYHFALLPRLIRNRLPKATIITFWHIPWPNSESFSICPWREQIIDGMLGSTILGFHTQFHCNNFIEAVDRFMESRIDREQASVTLRGHETTIRPYPISIEWPPAALAHQAPVPECRDAIIKRFSLPRDVRIAVGIERFDYTKGIADRIRAVNDVLTRRPEWKGRFIFIQVAAPTRSKLGAYSALQGETVRLAEEVNARHGDGSYLPIRLIVQHHKPDDVYELFRAADVCIVSSLHDGMNLVAKEFVAARDDERGVLILSSFAGASRELSEALIVNPYDTRGMASAIDSALRMPDSEQRERMRLLRDVVRQRNVYRWAAQMLLDAARVRRRASIAARPTASDAPGRAGG